MVLQLVDAAFEEHPARHAWAGQTFRVSASWLGLQLSGGGGEGVEAAADRRREVDGSGG